MFFMKSCRLLRLDMMKAQEKIYCNIYSFFHLPNLNQIARMGILLLLSSVVEPEPEPEP